jgi:hypothetical protein
MNSSCKIWWNIVKQISGIKGSDMSIPPILHNDNLIFDDIERANLFNIYLIRNERLNNLQRGCLIIGAASFNSLGLIKSGPDAFVGFITFRTSSTSFSHVINYRPISLLSVISKCMEHCVYKHIHNHLLDNDILTTQFGFTKGDSADKQLINITNDFGKALDSGKEVRVVFCDISKAFDRVWHKGLIPSS